ncbi:MAG TPA: UdgX family uracil-DNA binding protein [Nocardia sp.]|uniref:UdgX family uracil-DNA binding protein n=1 Tax=Nocardia TaxID=1817 RepID=UPI00245490F8|nr:MULTISPECIES: UdgX family uracil-DNA binding protein [Nocardia]HLS78097.1 UdgX family uracil-DNA binding protein [Nocardia sp.]
MTATDYLPSGRPTLRALAVAAEECHGCALYRDATQTVFGEGPAGARIVMIGEQPGDREDRAGHPFVGPAGGLLDRALTEAGIARAEVYLTNAVKHFKFTERGARRIHKQPGRTEIVACAPWLEQELRVVRPAVVVCLGAVAAKAILGPSVKVTEQRGAVLEQPDFAVVATVHPSSVLRAPDRGPAYEAFVADLRVVAELCESPRFGERKI